MDPATAAAIGSTALQGAKWAWNNRDNIIKGGSTAVRLGKKYYNSAVKPLANTLFSSAGRKKAASAIYKKITNPVKTIKEASNYLASGKGKKLISGIAKDAHSALSAAEAISGKDMSAHKSLISQTHQQADRYHDIASQYNNEARQTFGLN